MKGYILAGLVLLVVVAGIGSIVYYNGGDRHELKYTFENGATVYTWHLGDGRSSYEQMKLHLAPNKYNMPPFWSRDDLPEGTDLHPSYNGKEDGVEFSNYYFNVSQNEVTQYIVEKGGDSYCFAGHCGFAEVLGYRFTSSELLLPSSEKDLRYNPIRFYSVVGPVFWARTTDAGPNNVFVYRGAAKRGPYAEVSSFMMVEGKPVYVAMTTETSNTGSRKETMNSYALVHDFKSIVVDCAALNPPPALPKTDSVEPEAKDGKDEVDSTPPPAPPAPQNFVAVVEPFNAQLCGKDVKIGLDRLVEKSVEDGKEVTVETLYYSLDGVRHEIPAEVTAPRNLVVPPNRNTAL